jgi:flagellar L-ring protein precursor FlgH
MQNQESEDRMPIPNRVLAGRRPRQFLLPLLAVMLLLAMAAPAQAKRKKEPKLTPAQQYVTDLQTPRLQVQPTPGSLFTPQARFADLGRDLRASQVGDIVTIVVSDRASAVARAATSSKRTSNASAKITGLAGPRLAPGLNPLAALGGESALDGEGSTTRSNTLTATVTARVVDVMPNGYLVLEGIKDVQANSERQRITVRGIARWNDITPQNTIRSDRVGQVEILINGKGVVGDAVRRPNFLYRLILGLLPF